MSTSLDFFDTRCDCWPIEVIYTAGELRPSMEFSINICVNFHHLQLDFLEADEDRDIDYCVDSPKEKAKTFLFRYDQLMNPETADSAISSMLEDMCIDVEAFMVEKIKRCAEGMAMSYRDVRCGMIFRIGVAIDVLVDELPPILEEDEGTDDTDNHDEMEEFINDEIEEMQLDLDLIPASKSSIDALKIVKIEDSKVCSICLDSIEQGKEASRMPCSHVFHGDCITRWLIRNGICPLCRFEMPID